MKGSGCGTVKGLKESDEETLEDVFIRLVSHSIEELKIEREELARRSSSVRIHKSNDWSDYSEQSFPENLVRPMLG